MKTAVNPHYQFVTTHENYEETCKTLDPEGYELINDSAPCMSKILESPMSANPDNQLHAEEDEKDSEDELEYIEHGAVCKWQYTQDVLMDNMFPENQINVQADDNSEIANIEYEGVSVGPGEGQMPTNILAEKDWDMKNFSRRFPNGKYGLHHSREQRLTNFQYFTQGLLNKDSRYASSPYFVYAAGTYIEKQQLEGTRKSTEEGKTIFNLEDSFAVLDKISNTPKCIGNKLRMNSLPNWKSLGHFNFSSHCHVQRSCHVENFAVILKNSLGDKPICYKYRSKPKVLQKTPMNHNQRLHL